jgi:tetratricopeptide (TPR) repeat protein
MLVPLLEADANDGPANLAMARVLMKEQRTDDALSYYHRAIYGRWPRGANQSEMARFELIDVLAGTDAKHDLLAELLPIEDDSTVSIAQRKRIALLFVTAGSPSRAIAIFRDVLRRDPRDADAYRGLAEAALSVGDFSTAKADLLAAQKLVPGDSVAIESRISVIDSVVSLDPTQRGLATAEQYRRSRNLVQMTVASVRKCLGAQAPEVAALDSTGSTLVASAAAAGQKQSIDQTLLLAEQLWTLQRGKCASGSQPGALALVQNRIAQ